MKKTLLLIMITSTLFAKECITAVGNDKFILMGEKHIQLFTIKRGKMILTDIIERPKVINLKAHIKHVKVPDEEYQQ